ncbi:hypothetical protein [Nocardia higoensis]|uniref:hypothetical protein n=1 Tax=Nocardia higoensis TaxID=228599 RepID=UPI00031B366A|nr:hypothetical protein [Nocardia higoensis]
MSAPLDQSIVDLLRDSALGSMVDRPVEQVLRELGLPALPQFAPLPPLPELPPLPVLDLGALIKPMTDLAGSFGSGVPGAGQGPDPSQVLPQVVSVLQSVTQLGTTAIQTVMSLWEGAGATSAAGKAARTAVDTTEVAAQGTRMHADHAAAANSVFTGYALVAAAISKYLASLAAAGAFIGTPAGQAFVVAATAETMAEVTAAIAKTRAELTVHSAEVTVDGRKVPVTAVPEGVAGAMAADAAVAPLSSAASAPLDTARALTSAGAGAAGGLDPAQYVTQALQLVQGLVSVGVTGAQAVGQAASLSDEPGAAPGVDGVPVAPFTAPVLAGVPGGSIGGGAATPAPLPLQEARTATLLAGGGAGPQASVPVVTSAAATTPGMVPMAPGPMGAAGAAARAAGAGGDVIRGDLVNAAHGSEVVGPIDGVAVPVIGAAEAVTTTPEHDPEPPDKALTL